jgi:hypothetical protein
MRALALLCLATAACAPTAAEVAQQERRAATDAQEVDRALVRLIPGTPTSCLTGIDRRQARSRSIGSTVLYTVNRGRVFRNDMNGNCNLSGDPILVTVTPTDALCRGDIVQLVDRTSRFPVGSCSYGDFIPYTRAK